MPQFVFRIVIAVTILKHILWYRIGHIVIFNHFAVISNVVLLVVPTVPAVTGWHAKYHIILTPDVTIRNFNESRPTFSYQRRKFMININLSHTCQVPTALQRNTSNTI